MKPGEFVTACWERAAQGLGEDERERIEGPVLHAEVYVACDLARLSFTYLDGGVLKPTPKMLSALAVLEKDNGLTREVRTPPDASGDFNFILTRDGTYVARVTPGKLFVEPKACGRALGEWLLALYERR